MLALDGQDLATQHELLKAAGAELVYSEKQSGAKTDRAALARCMRSLEPGDTIVVTKLDRGPDQLGTYSILWPSSAKLGGALGPWAILGPIQQRLTGG